MQISMQVPLEVFRDGALPLVTYKDKQTWQSLEEFQGPPEQPADFYTGAPKDL